jgi:hypothetical protein
MIPALTLGSSRLAAQTAPVTSPVHSGAWIIGGTGQFDHADGQTNLSLAPTALDFVTPHVAVGGMGLLGLAQTSGSGHSYSWGLGPSVRLFPGDPSSLTLPFVSASVIPEWATRHSTVSGVAQFNGDVDTRVLTLDGSIGVTRMLATHAGLTGEAYLTHYDFRNTAAGSTSSSGTTHYGIRLGLTVFVH